MEMNMSVIAITFLIGVCVAMVAFMAILAYGIYETELDHNS